MMKILSNCIDKDDKVVCIELGAGEFEIPFKKIDYAEEEDGYYEILVDK